MTKRSIPPLEIVRQGLGYLIYCDGRLIPNQAGVPPPPSLRYYTSLPTAIDAAKMHRRLAEELGQPPGQDIIVPDSQHPAGAYPPPPQEEPAS